jgi:SAM-dependent methyltransferase
VDRAALKMEEGVVRCAVDATHIYPFEDGILRLVPPESRRAIDAQSAAYEAARAAQGWTSPDEGAFKSLPQTGLSGYPEGYWSYQASGTALLWRFLEAIRLQNGGLPIGPMGEAAVIGAGMGWLAYGLDVAGYTTLAIDTHAGARFGLGVYPIARYLRVQADRINPPLARSALDLLIFQEGLAQPGDGSERQMTLQNAIRALRPGGWLAVMDVLPESAQDAEAVRAMIHQAGLLPMDAPQRNGWQGRFADLRGRLSGRDAAIPPVMLAQKPK